jgi:3-phosphoshikimate 1-carboxyvinyltransferase
MDKIVARFPTGNVTLPPSKSVLHRVLICEAIAGMRERPLDENSTSDDITATARCLAALRWQSGVATLDCGESGSTLRFLIPLAAAIGKTATFTGRGRLLSRPMAPFLDELRRHRAVVEQSDDAISVSGQLEPGVYELPGNVSSQFVTGLLLALPRLHGDSAVHLTSPLESRSYVDITCEVLSRFGVDVRPIDGTDDYAVPGWQKFHRRETAVEGDYSQAAFFLVAGALGRDVAVHGLTQQSRQGDRAILDILRRAGIRVVETENDGIKALPSRISPVDVDVSDIPDLVPPLAALLCFADGESRLYNAARLRMKESDRLEAVATELNNLGADIRIDGDSLVIRGVSELHGGAVDSRGDHRIAMMGAVAAVRCGGSVTVRGAECVSKSYPDFWRDFEVSDK